ncbi:hypothetical protein AIOL_002960 [Candidatus Rhodobacter oscarellae]|uniref:SGNH hydrolase-type esterase domain-containing protein n=1 Tax=Candidatus Rhodobacter oscarellae TaxID=1675527 RepID=A0A0J9E5G7_9RHOB|nr:SGNH/GDSL hydrolase family protein [Candidatus Rhodobacter lobularis]KMW57992.1 hypothetical protein AIOL_002960 [Candidatus Rhodobacter lobularis]
MIKLLLRAAAVAMGLTTPAWSDGFVSPTILVLGDSQIPFGTGPAFLEFFEHLKDNCDPNRRQAKKLDTLADMKIAVIGVRSTSLQSWTSTSGATKRALCDVDPKWKVNAGVFGFINTTDNKYKQIGRGPAYQFCKPGKTAFEVMFRPDYYQPKLILMSFLGNSAQRWANDYQKALRDVRAMNAQLPAGVPCIFMTTAPSYSQKVTALRVKAQTNIGRAFAESNSQCSFIEGATPETIAANQGNKKFFRLNKSGRVKDPYHPNKRAAKAFFTIEMDNICSAIFEQLDAAMPEIGSIR